MYKKYDIFPEPHPLHDAHFISVIIENGRHLFWSGDAEIPVGAVEDLDVLIEELIANLNYGWQYYPLELRTCAEFIKKDLHNLEFKTKFNSLGDT